MKKQLISELNDQLEPNVKIWVDDSAMFWLSETSGAIFMSNHRDISDYIDEDHKLEHRNMEEGVGGDGVEWMNGDFESPFHITDFLKRIEEINTLVNEE